MAEGIWAITAVLNGGQQVAAQLDALQMKMTETNTVGAYAMIGLGAAGLAASVAWTKAMVDAGAAAGKIERVMNRVFGGRGNAMAEFSRQMAESSTISFQAIGEAVNRMGAMNMSASETKETIRALTDTVGALGMGSDEFNAMADAMAAVNEQGVAGMRVFQMFARRYGIPLPDILKKQLGIDIGTDLGAMKLEGIPRQRIMEAIRKGLGELYAGGAAQALNTWGGLLAHARNQLDMMNESSGKLIIQGLKPLTERFDALTVSMKKVNEATGGTLGVIASAAIGIGSVITMIGGLNGVGKLAWVPQFVRGAGAIWTSLAAVVPEILLFAAALGSLYVVIRWIRTAFSKGVWKAEEQAFMPFGPGGPGMLPGPNDKRWMAGGGKTIRDQVKAANGEIERHTKRTADAIESLKSALVGAGQRAQRRMTDMEAQTSIARALKGGIA